MSWEIRANLGPLAPPTGGNPRGWLWELTRGEQVVRIAIEIGETAWSSDPLSLPEDTREALETDGRAELVKILELDDPPSAIHCDSRGCTSSYAENTSSRT